MQSGGRPIRGHFSKEEEDLIRQAMLQDVTPLCPRCGEQLISNLPKGGRCSRREVWEFHCELCLQSAVVEDDLH